MRARGPEIMSQVVRIGLESHPDWVCCKLDFRNAFNMVSRVAFLRYAARYFPTLLLFLLAAYGAPAYITALGPDGWVRFLSRRGCTQGCPLGPLCHAAGLQPALEQVHHGFPDVLLAACTMTSRLQGVVAAMTHAALGDPQSRCAACRSSRLLVLGAYIHVLCLISQ